MPKNNANQSLKKFKQYGLIWNWTLQFVLEPTIRLEQVYRSSNLMHIPRRKGHYENLAQEENRAVQKIRNAKGGGDLEAAVC